LTSIIDARASDVDEEAFGDTREEREERKGRARKVRVANYASDVWVPRGARQMQIMPTNFSENSRILRQRERERERESRPNIRGERYVRV